MPDFSTLCRRHKTLNVSIPYRGGTGPLNLLIDSTGINAEGEGSGTPASTADPDGASGARYTSIARQAICEANLPRGGIDAEPLEARAVEVTGSNIGDAPVLPELLDQIPSDEEIGSGTADRAYDTRRCHEAIAVRGAAAVIPPRKNAKPWKPTSPGAVARNEAPRAAKYLGRAICRRWSGDHRRSRVEAKMNGIKRLGQSLMVRDFDRQVAELQVRIAVLNGYTALGMPVTVAAG